MFPPRFPKEIMLLTAKNVAALDLAGKADIIHFDDTMACFGYRIRAGAGGKVLRSWVVQYRRGGATRRLLVGRAEVLGAEQARAAAKKILAKVALGEDPQADRTERRGKDRLSLRSVVEEFLSTKTAEVRPSTIRELKRYLTGPYFRPLYGMPIDKVTRRDIASRLVAVTREHGSRVAAQSRVALSGFFVWAMRSGFVEVNPVTNTPQPQGSKARERVLNDDELGAIWRACGDDDYGRIIRLLTLTGCRRSEIGGMAWSEINFDRGSWTLPATRSKNGRAHTLPMMPAMLEIVAKVPHRVSRDQLFGARSNGFSTWGPGKRALDVESGVTDWTVHDTRRSVATGLANLGVQPHIIETVLNHFSGHRRGVSGIYNKSTYEREVRAALALWADHVRSIADGGEKVIHLLPQAAT
jgi:integrase